MARSEREPILSGPRLEQEARAIVGSRRSGEIGFEVRYYHDGNSRDLSTARFWINIGASIGRVRLRDYCRNLYGGRAVSITQIEENHHDN